MAGCSHSMKAMTSPSLRSTEEEPPTETGPFPFDGLAAVCTVEPIDDIPATRRCYGGTWALLAERSCTLTPDAHPSAGSFVRTILSCQSLPRRSAIHPPR